MQIELLFAVTALRNKISQQTVKNFAIIEKVENMYYERGRGFFTQQDVYTFIAREKNKTFYVVSMNDIETITSGVKLDLSMANVAKFATQSAKLIAN